MLNVDVFKVSPLETNCYLIMDQTTKASAIIDPGGISSDLDNKLKEIGKDSVKYILLTHGHFDHIRKANRYRKLTGAQIMIGIKESEFTKNRDLNLCSINMPPFEANRLLKDGDIINLGQIEIRVVSTPGHTIGGVCYVVENYIFSGDTIMKHSIGRSDLKTGNFNQLKESIKKIAAMKDNYKIYPGHGDSTSLQDEKENNIYFKRLII